jgi:hypothetical protein
LLYNIFNGDKKQKISDERFYARPELFPHKFLRGDEYYETMWTVTRTGMPDWQVGLMEVLGVSCGGLVAT